MMNKKTVIALTVCLLIGFVSGWFIRKRVSVTPVSESHTDTTYIEKSIKLDSFIATESKPAPPIAVPRDSIVFIHDTLYIPAETKTVRDTAENIAVEAVVTGVQPMLQSLQVTYLQEQLTTIQTIVKPFEGWKLSVTSNNMLMTQSFASLDCLEFSYTTGPFQFGLQGGALLTKPFQGNLRVDPYLGGRITLDIHKFQ